MILGRGATPAPAPPPRVTAPTVVRDHEIALRQSTWKTVAVTEVAAAVIEVLQVHHQSATVVTVLLRPHFPHHLQNHPRSVLSRISSTINSSRQSNRQRRRRRSRTQRSGKPHVMQRSLKHSRRLTLLLNRTQLQSLKT